MIVRDIMAKTPIWLDPQTSLMSASRFMRDRDIGCVLVGDKDKLVGMVTDRDIATRAVAKGWDPRTKTVKDVMTRGVVYCKETQKLREAAKLMEDKRVRRLAVLDDRKRLVGVVSVADIARSANGGLVSEVMCSICRPARRRAKT
jgi:CBS domain-containing protein